MEQVVRASQDVLARMLRLEAEMLQPGRMRFDKIK